MLIELKNIKKHYPIRKGFMGKDSSVVRAVDGIDLKVIKGENLSLVGESGSGKTTLARIIMRLIKETSGEIYFNGNKISRNNIREFRQNVQMVFQDPFSSLDPRYTVRNIIKEALTLDVQKKYKTKDQKEKRLVELLKAVKLEENMLHRYPHEFSGGERQRIAIARALALNPKLVILDEAVSSLDVIVQQQILDLLADLKNKFDLTYIFISHNLRVVRKISKRVAVMYKGKIVELGSVEQIFQNPLHPYTQQLLKAAIEYKAIDDKEIIISSEAKLVDQGNGHFVISNL